MSDVHFEVGDTVESMIPMLRTAFAQGDQGVIVEKRPNMMFRWAVKNLHSEVICNFTDAELRFVRRGQPEPYPKVHVPYLDN